MKNSFVLEEFRKLPAFKQLKPFLRKTIINIGKVYPNTLFNIENPHFFKCDDITDCAKKIDFGACYNILTIKQKTELTKLLHDISVYNKCISYHITDCFQIKEFTIKQTNNKHEFVYHRSNVNPDIILKEGLKKHYSLGVKCHPPMVFVGKEPCWPGDFTYKIKTNKTMYIDTNLDWQMRDERGIYCIADNIEPNEIVEWQNNFA